MLKEIFYHKLALDLNMQVKKRPGIDAQSDDEINEYIRSKADTAYHPCGTCKMGVDECQ